MQSQRATVPPNGVVKSGAKHYENEKQKTPHDDEMEDHPVLHF